MFFNDYVVFIYIGLFVILYNILKAFIRSGLVKNLAMISGSVNAVFVLY